GFQEREAHPLARRHRLRVEIDDVQVGVLAKVVGQLATLRRDEHPATFQMAVNEVPVEVGLGHEEDGVGRQRANDVASRVEQCGRWLGKGHYGLRYFPEV